MQTTRCSLSRGLEQNFKSGLVTMSSSTIGARCECISPFPKLVVLDGTNDENHRTGSSDHIQHGDLDRGELPPRRWPHVFAQGPWNQYGYDGGLPNEVALGTDGLWKYKLMAEWPNKLVLNVWGMNPDGAPDKTQSLGDVDGDNVLDWLPPNTLSLNVVNVSKPAMPYLGVMIVANDGNYGYSLVPVGSVWNQVILAILIAVVPILSAVAAIFVFRKSFYQVKFNEIGLSEKSLWTDAVTSLVTRRKSPPASAVEEVGGALAVDTGAPGRRTVLVATMEYEIEVINLEQTLEKAMLTG